MERIDIKAERWAELVDRAAGSSGIPARPADGPYGPLLAAGDLVIGQVGQSLDGRVATSAGDATDVSGRDGLIHLHRLRALVDAVLVGASTAMLDDPRLTVRFCAGPAPARVLIDPRGRVPNDRRLFAEDGARRLVIQATDTARPSGVEVIRLPHGAEGIAPAAIVAALRERGLPRLLVEGGAATLGHFHRAAMLDRLHIAVAPLIIGAGPPGLSLVPVDRLRDCPRPRVDRYDLGTDTLFDCDFRSPPPRAAAG
ncbi:RibD family protein [Prosthecomicrobium pneumaticum]|uniref:Riboflavin-specific deaminase-like protein n=1 Tax=Prosthecomicrobium pneumaticum TaxID=81895 RepID=A0A7W9FPE3_9HYPH|nr:RibD family protein [Prosthecomicrobium pneumaticum]MBB5754437.1 riboflavin-specific deaminase-like protein [Prosthecomicrobium pneumaticum]